MKVFEQEQLDYTSSCWNSNYFYDQVARCKTDIYLFALDLELYKRTAWGTAWKKVEARDGSAQQQDLMINLPTDDKPTGYTRIT